MWKLSLCLFQSILSLFLSVYRWGVTPANCSETFTLGCCDWTKNLTVLDVQKSVEDNLIDATWGRESLQKSQVSAPTHWPRAYRRRIFLVFIRVVRPAGIVSVVNISSVRKWLQTRPDTSAATLFRTQILPQSGKCAAVLRKEDRNRRPSPPTNDFCSALALDACCMQRPMKRKVCPFDFFSSDLVSLCAFVCFAALSGGKGRVPCVSFKSQAEAVAWWMRTPLLISASSLLLHECVLPADEGDQDGSLYFLPSRCCFACVFPPVLCF